MTSSRFQDDHGPAGHRSRHIAGSALLGVLAAVIGSAPELRAEPAAPALALSDAWVRAMPPGQTMTAAYLEVVNQGEAPVTITGVSAGTGMASLHETQTVDGRSSMRPIASLTVAPGEAISLQPGGLHIMLMGLERTPVAGEDVAICLVTDGGQRCIDAAVSRGPVAGSADADRHHH